MTAPAHRKLERLVAKWRREAKAYERDLGAAHDGTSRTLLRALVRTLSRCADELERTLEKL